MSFKVPLDARQEVKFVTRISNLPVVYRWLNTHYAGFYNVYSDRKVNNIYFDTFNYDAYKDNLSGTSSRLKVRYRWYEGSDIDIGKGQLEAKIRRNFFGWKHIYKVHTSPFSVSDTWNDVKSKIIKQLPLKGVNLLYSNPLPVMINRYHRSYYLSMDEKVRITIDKSQQVYDQRRSMTPNFKMVSLLPSTVVIEFKFDRSNLSVASDLIQSFPVRVSRHSKYVNAVDTIAWNYIS